MNLLVHRIRKVLMWCCVFLVRLLAPVKRNRLTCMSYVGMKYACNPRSITDFMLENHKSEFDIWWVVEDPTKDYGIPNSIRVVKKGSLKYLWVLYTSKVFINNMRTSYLDDFWWKRKDQLYVMTWHSSMSIKKVEKDAAEQIGEDVCRNAMRDSEMCDLIFSGARFRTNIIKNSFWYNGEILEKGTPRNDILFDVKKHEDITEIIKSHYSVPSNTRVLLYAPTFRKDKKLDVYKLDWSQLIDEFKNLYKQDFIVFLRLHPNMSKMNISELFTDSRVIDVTSYPDMHRLMICSDVLLTDYSSSLFDMCLTGKPCFLYVPDLDSYDRGIYINIKDMPFPYALTQCQLYEAIRCYNYDIYSNNVFNFLNDTIETLENGQACESFYSWLKEKI